MINRRAGRVPKTAVAAMVALLLWQAAALPAGAATNSSSQETSSASSAFVAAAYEDVLGRIPSAEETSYWVDKLLAGAPRSSVASGFNNSEEYRRLKIDAAYSEVLGRVGETEGIDHWLGAIAYGSVDADEVHPGFLGSDEFYLNQGGGTPSGYITAVYQDLFGRDPEPEGLAHWIFVMESMNRGYAADGLWHSTESYNAKVVEAYALLLGREPDADGLSHWVGIARQYGLTAMRTSLMSSDEYWSHAQSRF